jgi:hypothetical protein
MKSARVSDEILTRLRNGKRDLRVTRRNMSLPEKVAEVVRLQRITLSAIRRRREPTELEYVWPLRDGDR